MPINANIPLQTRVFKPRSTTEAYGSAMKLKNLAGQSRIQEMQLSEAERALGDKTRLSELWTASEGDQGAYYSNPEVLAIGGPEAMEAKTKYDRQSVSDQSDKLDLKIKGYEMFKQSIIGIMNSPDPVAAFESTVQEYIMNKVITPEDANRFGGYSPEKLEKLYGETEAGIAEVKREQAQEQQTYDRGRHTAADTRAAESLAYEREQDVKAQTLVDKEGQEKFDLEQNIVEGAIDKKGRLNKVIDDLIAYVQSPERSQADIPFTGGYLSIKTPNMSKGLLTETMAGFGGTDAKTMEQYLTEIKSIVGLDNLIDIKSKGGTFGALSDRELEVITGIFGSMDIGDTNLVTQLLKVKSGYAKLSADLADLFKKKYPGGSPSSQSSTPGYEDIN